MRCKVPFFHERAPNEKVSFPGEAVIQGGAHLQISLDFDLAALKPAFQTDSSPVPSKLKTVPSRIGTSLNTSRPAWHSFRQ